MKDTNWMNADVKSFIYDLKDRELSTNTIESYEYALRLYFERYDEISKENMLDFKNFMIEKYKSKTAACRITTMNLFCDFIDKPKAKVRQLKIQDSFYISNVISKEEYEKILNYCLEKNKTRLYWIVKFLACTGCRVNELVKLNYSCLLNYNQTLHSKGKERFIIIPKNIADEAKKYFGEKNPNDALFVNRFGERITTRGISELLKQFEDLGVRKEVLHPHSFRHFFALNLLEKSGDIVLVSSLLGHSGLNTTNIYLKKSKEEREKEFNKVISW